MQDWLSCATRGLEGLRLVSEGKLGLIFYIFSLIHEMANFKLKSKYQINLVNEKIGTVQYNVGLT